MIPTPQDHHRRGPPLALVVVILGAIPLFFVLLPFLSVILGALTDFTGSMLSTDSHNLAFNAFLPWLAMSFLGAAGFIIFMSLVFFGHDVSTKGR